MSSRKTTSQQTSTHEASSTPSGGVRLQRGDARLLGVALFAMIAAGCLPAPGADNAFYVLIPYAVSLLMAGLIALGLLDSSPTRASLRRTQQHGPDAEARRGQQKLRTLLVCGIISSISTVVGELVHTLLHGDTTFGVVASHAPDTAPNGLVFVVLYLLCMSVAALCFARIRTHVNTSPQH